MEEIYNKHYITEDDQGRILDGWSDGPHPEKDTSGTICINEQGGYQFRLFSGGEENPALWTMDGIPLYKYEDSQVVPRTEEEIAADRAAIPEPPPTEHKIKAMKAQLSATDYQIIKCSEYQFMGLDLPYDVAALHAQRQALRDEINALEEKENKEAGADEAQ